MTLSKRSLNFFANQYNVAVTTKAAFFKVENTQINREILDLLYKEGLILDYSFNFSDIYQDKDDKKSNKDVLLFSRKIKRKINPKLYFFDLVKSANIERNKLPTKILNDKTQTDEDLFVINRLSNMSYRQEEDLILYIYKILDLFYMLKFRYNAVQAVALMNRTYSVWYEPLSSVLIESNIEWDDMFLSLSSLYKVHECEDMHHIPIRFLFSPKLEEKFLDYISYLYNTDISFRENPVITRAEMQIEFSQDEWKYQDTVFEDDRIFVFPKYYAGVPVVKKIRTCGKTVVWKHVSVEELNHLKQEQGYTTLYLLSTPTGLVLDAMSSLLIQEGGLLLLSFKI